MKVSSLLQYLGMIVVFVGIAFLLRARNEQSAAEKAEKMDYSQLVQLIKEKPDQIKSITIANGSNEVTVERTDGTKVPVVLPGKAGEQAVLEAAAQAKVNVIATENSGGIGNIILYILFNPLTILLLIWLFISFRGMNPVDQIKSFGKTQGNKYVKDDKRKTFDDVAGATEAKEELAEVVRYLKAPGEFLDMGARMPRGVLLKGPPGTGKTLLAKAVAGEADVPFFHMSGSQFEELFVGVGAGRARSMFAEARKNQPAVIFIDEIDAIGRQRGTGITGVSSGEQTLNEILVQMDGFLANEAVVVIAATNRADMLDEALTRPGRFDRHVTVDLPDVAGREAILKVHSRNKKLDPTVDLKTIAVMTPGFSGAALEAVCNEGAAIALRRINKITSGLKAGDAQPARVITLEDLSEGVDRVSMGPARRYAMSKEEKMNTAVHEAGHAAVGFKTGGDPVRKITILPRAKALGFTQSNSEGDVYGYTEEQLKGRLAMIMGGRAAQEIILKTCDTGASNDFVQATQLARRMVTQFGMSKLGHISVSDESTNPFLGRTMAHGNNWGPAVLDQIDAEVRRILEEAYQQARTLVEDNRKAIDRVVEVLMAKETILGAEFEACFQEAPAGDSTPAV